MGKTFDIKHQLAFYHAYHNNPVNQWIHICAIPLILWTSMVLLSWVVVPTPFLPGFEAGIPLPWVTAVVYGVFYVLLDPPMGLAYCPLLAGMAWGSLKFVEEVEDASQLALGLWVFCWLIQFVGHGVFEQRAPALLDSFAQALLLAPLFVGVELLFMLGLRKDLHEDMHAIAMKDIMAFRKQQSAKAQ